eukprot:9473163-Pyramimonas_sp.AAC.1
MRIMRGAPASKTGILYAHAETLYAPAWGPIGTCRNARKVWRITNSPLRIMRCAPASQAGALCASRWAVLRSLFDPFWSSAGTLSKPSEVPKTASREQRIP